MEKKQIAILALVVLVFLGLLAGGCKRREKTRAAQAPPAEIKGDLNILHTSPQGPTQTAREAEEIVVMFDHPMVALQPLPQVEEAAPIKFEPPLAGICRWMGTKTLTFSPKERIPFGTSIKATIPKGTRSLDGYGLKEDKVWSFETIRPRLVRYFPENNQGQLRLDTKALLIFNQPVEANMVKGFIALTAISPDGKDQPLDFSLGPPAKKTLEDADLPVGVERSLLLEAAEPLKPDFSYAVELRSGLPGKEGRLGMDKAALFRFNTFKTFRFEGPEDEEGQDPYDSVRLNFSNRVIYKDLVQKIRFDPPVEIPEYYSEWDHGQSSLYLSVPLQPETTYTIHIAADLKDEFGNSLGREAQARLSTTGYKPYVDMATGHGIIEAYGNLAYPFYACNATSVKLRAARVGLENVIPVLDEQRLYYTNKPYSPEPGFFQLDKVLKLTLPRNQRQVVPLELRNVLSDRYGFIFLELDTLVQEDRTYPKAFLQVTELGISAKFSFENNVIWVTELRTGQPVAGADIEIRDDGNAVRWRGKTDVQGKVETPGWKRLGIRSKNKWDKPHQWVFARRGQDLAFVSSNWGTGIEPYRFNIYEEMYAEPEKIHGSIFTERGIYRAGELVHIKGVVRKNEKGQWKLPDQRNVDCEIKDPFEKTVFKGKLALDAFGSFAHDLETREDASLGTYSISASIPSETKGGREYDIRETFRVEAFRPAEFEVHLRTLKESFIFGDMYQAEIRGTYLYGGAMSGQKASWSLRLNPSSFAPPGHKGFIFGNEMDFSEEEGASEKSRLVASAEGSLDPQGRLEIKAPLVPEKETSTVSASLEATVESPSRRSISNRINAIVHRGEYYIGLRANSSFLTKGEKVNLQVIAAYPDGAIASGKRVRARLIKREWRSVRKAEVGGRFKWVSEQVDSEAGSQELQTRGEPVEIFFQPEKSGFYLLAAESQDGRKNKILTSTYLYVTGKDYVPWERRDDDSLELVADSDQYKPGETAKILVKSPYERAKALVSVEREMILQSQVLEIQGSTSQIEIPITSEAIPNIYVSVLLVQGRTSKASAGESQDVGKPSFKIGYVSLKVDPSEKRLFVDMTADKKGYKPRDNVSLRLKVQDFQKKGTPASVALAVVDVGVLNLIGYETPNLYGSFYGERWLSVQTSESRIHVVGQRQYGEKAENVGGGGGTAMAASMSLAEVELRGTFKSTAYWNPSIVTDANGEAKVEFALPDNLTTFRIMAVAQTKDSLFGQNELAAQVSKPILLLPSVPRFARQGDKFQAGVLINNNSSLRGNVQLGVEAKGILLKDKKNIQEFPLGPGEQKEILFSFEAARPGKANLSFRARMGNDSDGLDISIPVELPRPRETVATFDQASEPRQESLSIPEAIDPAESKLEVQAAASALTGLQGSLEYLSDYPYLCLEQRVSGILPFIVAAKVIQDFKLSPMSPNEAKALVQATIKEIYACQKESGGFGLWPDAAHESPFVSCYAVFALLKAQEAGFDVDKARLANSAAYLKRLIQAKSDTLHFPTSVRSFKTVQAFALYDLALLGRAEPSYAEKLFQERDKLSLDGRSFLLKAFYSAAGASTVQNTLIKEFLNKIKVTPSLAHFEEEEDPALAWIYSSNTRTTALILQTLIEVGQEHPLLPATARWLVEKRKAGHWHSTQENFFVFYALNDFYKRQERITPDFRAEISLARKVLLKESFKSATQTAKAVYDLSEFRSGQTLPLKIDKQGPGILYYGARLTYAPRQKLEPRDQGIAVYKTISSLDGKPLESIKAGTLLVVTLELVFSKESLYVVVDDPLPAGVEAVNQDFLTESEEMRRKLAALEGESAASFWEGFNHIELHDNRVLLFADSLAAGIHRHRYLARALTPGQFMMPGTKAEEMYAPEVFGRSAEQAVKIIK